MNGRTVLLIVLAAITGHAQAPTGTVSGRVYGPGATEIAGADVTIRATDREAPLKSVTDSHGRFAFSNLLAGSYQLTIEKSGFQKAEEKVELTSDQQAELEINLEPDPTQSPASARNTMRRRILRRDTSAATDSVGRSELLALPLSDDPLKIISQTAGLSLNPTEEGATSITVGGARNENANIFYDGFISVNVRTGGELIRPSLEALQTVKTKADANSAQFAKRAGLVATVVTKRGGDDYHGSVFGYFRGGGLNSRSFFDADKPESRRAQFGGVAGGPLWLPLIHNGRGRTFFFTSFEHFQETLGTTRLSGVATVLEHAGDFSQSTGAGGEPVILSDPFNPGTTYPGNRIPASLFSPAAQQIDRYLPLPNLSGSFNNYRLAASGKQRWDNLLVKVDHRFSDIDELSIRFQAQGADQHLPYAGSDLGTFGGTTQANTLLGGIIWYHQFSAKTFNEARTSIQRITGGDALDSQSPSFGTASGLPAYTFTGLASIGYSPSAPSRYAINYMEFADGFTQIRGKQILKFGFELQPVQLNQTATKNVRGTINFQDRTWTSKAYADFLMGLMRSSSLTARDAANYGRGTVYGLFVQDAIKLHPDLSLNLGLRYERTATPTEKNGNWSNFLLDTGTQVTSRPVDPGTPSAQQMGLPESLVVANKKGLTPRVGVALRPMGSDHVRLSASWGMFLSAPSPNNVRQDLAEVSPFLDIWKSTRNSLDPTILTLENPFPAGGLEKQSIAGYDLHPALPIVQSWNVSLQDKISKGRTLEVQYLGSKGSHLARRYDLNQSIKDVSMLSPTGSLPKLYPAWKNINYYSFGSNSSYNALLVEFTRRLEAGSTLRLNYTYAKSIDDASQSVPLQGFSGAQDTRYLWLERARSDWDARHAVKFTFDLQSPWKHSRWLRNWAFSGIGTFATGLPFTPQVQNPDTGKGEASRPDRLADGALDSPNASGWYDLAAFTPVATGSYRNGTSGRNVLSGPGTVSLDLGLRRPFNLDEKRKLEFRADAYNSINHANLGMPVTWVNAANAGTIVNAKPGRIVQLSGKMTF